MDGRLGTEDPLLVAALNDNELANKNLERDLDEDGMYGTAVLGNVGHKENAFGKVRMDNNLP